MVADQDVAGLTDNPLGLLTEAEAAAALGVKKA